MSRHKHFAPRIPLPVRGGIRAQGRRNSASRPWWGEGWIRAFEALRPGARLGRGRSYAVSGQVVSLGFSPGHLDAVVQGGGESPYAVAMAFGMLDAKAARRVELRLRSDPLLFARLLARDLPHRFLSWFEDEGVPLFPAGFDDFRTTCSCPDWSHVCKHVAAAYLLFGEALEQDPALLLRLRGLDLPEFDAPPAPDPVAPPPRERAAEAAPQSFWQSPDAGGCPPDFGPAGVTGASAPLARRLGPPPLWRGFDRFEEVADAVARRALPAGWRAWTGQREPPPPTATATPSTGFHSRRCPLRIDVTV